MNFFSRTLLHLGLLAASATAPAYAGGTIEFTADLATPVLRSGKTQTAFLKVGMTGFPLPRQGDRPPANVAVVIDKSGSMAGDRIVRAREAAIVAIDSLAPNDIVSVVAFDTTVSVIIPATRLAGPREGGPSPEFDRNAMVRAIQGIQAGGGTGLFAGVSKGAAEVRKNLERNRVNRVILLSDGKANHGPSSPAELGQLGAAFGRQGIAVTTVGLGADYNEDLMTQLAGYSDGNHAFARDASDLVRIFQREFGDVASVVAQEVEVTIRLKHGIRPVRILGREGEVRDGAARIRMNQLYSRQEKYVVLEVEVPPGKAGERIDLATADITYLNMSSRNQDRLSRTVKASFSESEEAVAKNMDRKAMAAAAQQVANEASKEAVTLRDQGKAEEAKKVLQKNDSYLEDKRQALGKDGEALQEMQKNLRSQADAMDRPSNDWNLQRKSMRESQHKTEKQQK